MRAAAAFTGPVRLPGGRDLRYDSRMTPIRIRLLFFAFYRDLAGTGELELEFPEGTTAATVVDHLRQSDGGFSRLPPAPVVAVNREYAELDSVLRDGDELALLPPVAGG
jgi:molybdopterin converting factor subunit 1